MNVLLNRLSLVAALWVVVFALVPGAAHGQQAALQTTVTVEALGSANIRQFPNTSAEKLGSIAAGTRFPVLGRSARVPWVFINFGDGRGWVFNDLVKVFGDLNSVPLLSENTEGSLGTPPPTVPPQATSPAASAAPIPTGNGVTPAPGLTPTPVRATGSPTNVFAEIQGELNVRFGPGQEFQRIGILPAGSRVPVLRRHLQYPWIEIGSDALPGGRGWVFKDAVRIAGNLNGVPSTSAREFGYPTLTPTQNQVVAVPLPGLNVTPDVNFQRLGSKVFEYLLSYNFEPNTRRQASAFIMDLTTGASVSLVPNVAYSGMSLIKIPILVEVYRKLDAPPNDEVAVQLAQMMICSNNDSTNAMLAFSGDGDALAGTRNVTETMQKLGLQDTFIASPLRSDPRATAVPIAPPKTTANQTATDPDAFNQSTPTDLGFLLGSVYACAKDGGGALTSAFPGQFNQDECRRMIQLLSSDKIGVMIEAGIPPDAQIAHKHGWVDQSLGDAGIVYTPGGNFVLVVMMSERPVLLWVNEFAKVSEVARQVYNYYNPQAPVRNINPKTIPEVCTLPDALLRDIQGR